VRRALGRQAVDDMEALRQIERELERQGYLQRNEGRLELTPKAVRRLGDTALRRVFADLPEGRHRRPRPARCRAGPGDYTGSTRAVDFRRRGSRSMPRRRFAMRLLRSGLPGASHRPGTFRNAVGGPALGQ